MSFPNIWNHRKVADTSAKACEVCFKPSTSVLITPESKDFFYVCPSHLKDRGFCSPIIDQEAVAAKKKKEMEEELERVKNEYEEKQRKKKEKESNPPKDSDKTKDGEEKDIKKDDKKDGKKDDPKPDSKVDKAEDKTPPNPDEEPRVFSLQRTFYQQRLDKKRQVEMAKRNRERLSNPNFFPSVPKNLP